MNALDAWKEAAKPPPRGGERGHRRAESPFAEYDYLGRKQPRRLGIPDFLLWVMRLDPERVRQVPASAIVDEGLDDEGEFSMIACPCGARPIARAELERCSGCDRHYVHVDLGAVYVAYGSMPIPGRRDEAANRV